MKNGITFDILWAIYFDATECFSLFRDNCIMADPAGGVRGENIHLV